MEETTIKRRPRKGPSPQKNRSKQGVVLACMLALVILLFSLVGLLTKDSAFSENENLKTVIIPDRIEAIGEYAFNCDQLRYVYIPENVTDISPNAFYHCDKLEYIEVDYDNTAYSSINGNLYNKDGTELIQYAIGKAYSSFTLPDSVTSIGDYAFCLCYNLADIWVSGSNPNYQSIDGNLYSKDGKKLVRYALGKLEASFEIPEGVTDIDPYAFYTDYNLISITIPESVISIGSGIFTDNLKQIINKSPNVYFEKRIYLQIIVYIYFVF